MTGFIYPLSKVGVVIANDSASERSVLRQAFLQTEFGVVAEAESGEEAYAAASRYRPAILLLDVRMPGENCLTTLSRLRADLPRTKVIVCATCENGILMRSVFQAGASGFIATDFPYDTILKIVRRVFVSMPGAIQFQRFSHPIVITS